MADETLVTFKNQLYHVTNTCNIIENERTNFFNDVFFFKGKYDLIDWRFEPGQPLHAYTIFH